MRIIANLVTAAAVAFLGPNAANAQQGGPLPQGGDSTKIMNSNRENNAGYNHVLATGVKSQNAEDRPAPQKKSAAVPATTADLKAGAALRDKDGVAIGTIDSVEADGAVVNTGQTKIKVPLVAFGKDNQGLLLGIAAAHFNELVAKAHSSN